MLNKGPHIVATIRMLDQILASIGEAPPEEELGEVGTPCEATAGTRGARSGVTRGATRVVARRLHL